MLFQSNFPPFQNEFFNDLCSNFLESGIKVMGMNNNENKYDIKFDIKSKQKLGIVLLSNFRPSNNY